MEGGRRGGVDQPWMLSNHRLKALGTVALRILSSTCSGDTFKTQWEAFKKSSVKVGTQSGIITISGVGSKHHHSLSSIEFLKASGPGAQGSSWMQKAFDMQIPSFHLSLRGAEAPEVKQ